MVVPVKQEEAGLLDLTPEQVHDELAEAELGKESLDLSFSVENQIVEVLSNLRPVELSISVSHFIGSAAELSQIHDIIAVLHHP